MSRRSFLLAVGIALALVGCSTAVLFLLVRHEPAAFRRAVLPPGEERARLSGEFKSKFSELTNPWITDSESDWDVRLTDDQINGYFAEDFKKSRVDEHLLPDNISEPRILFEPDKVRLAFRYGKGLWSTMISIDFGVWLPKRETNVVALQILGLQAGSLPICAQTLLDSLEQTLENNGIQVNWYRYEGHPVALLRFQSEQRDTTAKLTLLKVNQGNIVIRGKHIESGPTHAAALPILKPEAGN
jgi:hypothetical protein